MKSLIPLAALLCSACASVPPPTAAIASTDDAIRRAAAARVADYTPPELRNARERQVAAKSALAQRQNLAAARLTEEARLDAELSFAKAEAARVQFEAENMAKGNAALKQELLRDAANVAPIAIPAPVTDDTPAPLP